LAEYQRELEVARATVIEAAERCRQVQASLVGGLEKEDRSPVTVADFASQAVAAVRLKQAFPDDPLVAEERSQALRRPAAAGTQQQVVEIVRQLHPSATEDQVARWIDLGAGVPGRRFWTLDPIDGTAGFLRGDQWVVALALIEEGAVVLAALACPRLNAELQPTDEAPGCLLLAVRGQGAWLEAEGVRRPLQVSDCSQPQDGRVMGSFEASHTDPATMDRLRGHLGSQKPLIKMDSQAKFAMVAGGRAEMIFRLLSPARPGYREKIWDQAAGTLIVEQAGGRVTDLTGAPLDFSAGVTLARNRGVVVSNGKLHEAALAAVRAEAADQTP
jgi:3'(2'), 5'-bisphosphate nucleotidase